MGLIHTAVFYGTCISYTCFGKFNEWFVAFSEISSQSWTKSSHCWGGVKMMGLSNKKKELILAPDAL